MVKALARLIFQLMMLAPGGALIMCVSGGLLFVRAPMGGSFGLVLPETANILKVLSVHFGVDVELALPLGGVRAPCAISAAKHHLCRVPSADSVPYCCCCAVSPCRWMGCTTSSRPGPGTAELALQARVCRGDAVSLNLLVAMVHHMQQFALAHAESIWANSLSNNAHCLWQIDAYKDFWLNYMNSTVWALMGWLSSSCHVLILCFSCPQGFTSFFRVEVPAACPEIGENGRCGSSPPHLCWEIPRQWRQHHEYADKEDYDFFAFIPFLSHFRSPLGFVCLLGRLSLESVMSGINWLVCAQALARYIFF